VSKTFKNAHTTRARAEVKRAEAGAGWGAHTQGGEERTHGWARLTLVSGRIERRVDRVKRRVTVWVRHHMLGGVGVSTACTKHACESPDT
jgi:hypothetical protein